MALCYTMQGTTGISCLVKAIITRCNSRPLLIPYTLHNRYIVSQTSQNIKRYFQTDTRHVCTNSNLFSMVIPNMVMKFKYFSIFSKFVNCWICRLLLTPASHVESVNLIQHLICITIVRPSYVNHKPFLLTIRLAE